MSSLMSQEAHQAVLRLLAEQSLAHFLRQAWAVVEPSTPLAWGSHLNAICEHLEAVTAGQIQNLLICVPPGSTKSITCAVVWPAWVWGPKRSPGTRWLTAANGSDLVIRDAVACRRLIESDWYRENWGDVFSLTSDQNLKSWYENDGRGFRTATSVGSSITGRKGDILLLDDPDDAKKVRSDVERKNVQEWWDKGFYNRVNHHKTGRRVVIGQRLHEEDLIGHIIATGGFETLVIPEEFDPARRVTTSIGWTDWRTEKGQLLRDERFGAKEVAEAKTRLGAGVAGYDAQHNQNPVPTEGNRFRRENLRYYVFKDGWYHLGDAKSYSVEMLKDRFLTVDCAATAKQTAKDDPDYTVISAWSLAKDGELIWMGCWRGQVEIPDIAPEVANQYVRWKAMKAYVEGFGIGKGPVQLCQRQKLPDKTNMNIIPYTPEGKDKLLNATEALAMTEAKRLWLPADGTTFPLADVEAELLRFTGNPKQDGHDDIVDTLSKAAKVAMGKDTAHRTVQPGRVVSPGIQFTRR